MKEVPVRHRLPLAFLSSLAIVVGAVYLGSLSTDTSGVVADEARKAPPGGQAGGAPNPTLPAPDSHSQPFVLTECVAAAPIVPPIVNGGADQGVPGEPMAPNCPHCQDSFCPVNGVRCDISSCTNGKNGCCNYTCQCDSSCTSVSIPSNACEYTTPCCVGPGIVEFCRYVDNKCTATGCAGNCWSYSCQDEPCTDPPSCPPNACPGTCN